MCAVHHYDDHNKFKIKLGKGNAGAGYNPRGTGRYAILRCAKVKNIGNMAASLQHTFRERPTPNADTRKRDQNTVLLGGADSQTVLAAWKARAPEKIRTNAVHGLEYFIGSSSEAMHLKSREDQDAYFRDALEWIKQRHGAQNVLSAVIHRDETTPHMTVMTIPLDNAGKLNARAIVGNREKLSAMQTEFATLVGEPHDLERGVEGSTATHERVQRVYAHITDPTASVSLPERQKGAILGFGGESDADWHQRAEKAATDALTGIQLAAERDQRRYREEMEMMARSAAMKQEMQDRAGAVYAESTKQLAENRALAEQVKALQKEKAALEAKSSAMQKHTNIILETTTAFVQSNRLDEEALHKQLRRNLGIPEPKAGQPVNQRGNCVREKDDGWGHD